MTEMSLNFSEEINPPKKRLSGSKRHAIQISILSRHENVHEGCMLASLPSVGVNVTFSTRDALEH